MCTLYSSSIVLYVCMKSVFCCSVNKKKETKKKRFSGMSHVQITNDIFKIYTKGPYPSYLVFTFGNVLQSSN